jgi:hypothetical protein
MTDQRTEKEKWASYVRWCKTVSDGRRGLPPPGPPVLNWHPQTLAVAPPPRWQRWWDLRRGLVRREPQRFARATRTRLRIVFEASASR